MISVLRGDFLRKILALVAMDVNELRIPTGTIEIGLRPATRKTCESIIVRPCVLALPCGNRRRIFWRI